MKMLLRIWPFDLKRGRNQPMEEEEPCGFFEEGVLLYVSCTAYCVRGHDLSGVFGDPDMAGLGWKPDGWRAGESGAPLGVMS